MPPDERSVVGALDGRALAHRLSALSVDLQRDRALGEVLSALAIEDAIGALSWILLRVDDPECRAAWLSVVRVLTTGYPEEAARFLSDAARRAGRRALALCVMPSFAIPQGAAGEPAPEQPRDEVLQKMTLGERRWKARMRDRNLLDRLLRDPDPGVLTNLLDNPLIREDDVLKVATKRPVAGACLMVIARKPRWLARERVQLALVLNPSTPVRLSSPLVPLLPGPELARLVDDPSARIGLREAAHAVAQERSSLPGSQIV